MKILCVTTNYPTPEYPIFGIFVKEQVESLRKEGIDCRVFYCDGKGRGLRQYITYIPKLWWHLLTHRYDVIHCHHALSAIILMLTLHPLTHKCVLSYQNDPTREWGDRVFKILYPVFNRFIFKNRSEYLRYEKCEYLPNGCNAELFRPMDRVECCKQLGLDPDQKHILYMDSNKGVRTQKRKDRYDAALELLRTKYGHTNINSVELRNTPREEIPLYINSCSLHLMSSDFEGSPNSVKECMCCNTPVVSTPVGNVAEMLDGIEGSFVTESFTAEELAEKADRALRSTTPFNGREQFLAKGYSMQTVAYKLIDIYNKIVK